MHLTVSSTIPRVLHDEVAFLVGLGFDGVDTHDVEVHVKARRQERRAFVVEYGGRRWRYERKREAIDAARRHGATVETVAWRDRLASAWSARTYDGVPEISNVVAGTRYLVTMNIPADPRRVRGYPKQHRDPRLVTSPVVTFERWEDELLHLAAHEAHHVEQFRHGLPRSELACERWAAGVLAHQRAFASGRLFWAPVTTRAQ